MMSDYKGEREGGREGGREREECTILRLGLIQNWSSISPIRTAPV